jgi:hypothetical protein
VHSTLHRKKFDGTTDSCFVGTNDMDGVASVVLRGVANIPALDAVWRPGASLVGSFV